MNQIHMFMTITLSLSPIMTFFALGPILSVSETSRHVAVSVLDWFAVSLPPPVTAKCIGRPSFARPNSSVNEQKLSCYRPGNDEDNRNPFIGKPVEHR